jgi:hypothetical protein
MPAVVALLGRGELPANGVADYCENLAAAFAQDGNRLDILTVHWFDRGWIRGLADLWRAPLPSRGDWAILQYTAMGWSWRGFPAGAVVVMALLRVRGVRCGVVMHEPWSQGVLNLRFVDRIRAAFQNAVIRSLHWFGSLSVFTLPLAHIPWLRPGDSKSVFIPLGPNVPENLSAPYPPLRAAGKPQKVISVFCLSEMPVLERELSDISFAARAASKAGANVRVVFVGRGTDSASQQIADAFKGSGIESETLGLQDPAVISRVIVESDVLLCVRGTLNLRRGSALAGIACGVPIVGYAGAEDGTPLTEAGVSLAPLYDQAALGEALARVLTDDSLAHAMHCKNVATERKYFSWETVTRQYLEALHTDRGRA